MGPLEARVMEVLWNKPEFTAVPDVHRALTDADQDISYSAVKAVLNNLAVKGLLDKEKRGKVTHFKPRLSREEFDALVMTSVIGSLKRNFGRPLIAQFIDQMAVDEETLEDFERLIAQRKADLGR